MVVGPSGSQDNVDKNWLGWGLDNVDKVRLGFDPNYYNGLRTNKKKGGVNCKWKALCLWVLTKRMDIVL